MSDFIRSLIAFTSLTTMGVVSIFPLTGLTGLFSFGQAAYMGVGAYVSGILAVKLGVNPIIAIVIGVLAGGILAFIIGMPTLRLRSNYFSLMSLCLGQAITAILNKFSVLTGGAAGLSNIPKAVGLPTILIATVCVIVLVACFKVSRFGRMSLAIKQDELAARAFGINVFTHKMKVYVFTSMIAAFAGGLYAFYIQYIDPNMFGWTRSSEWVIFLFFGGVNSLTGSVISAITLNILPEVLRFATEARIAMYCIMILLVLNFRPQGLLGEKELSFAWLRHLLRSKGSIGGEEQHVSKG